MKRIGHQKTYRPHEFCYEKIELADDFPTDKPDEECFKELLSRIEAMAKVAYPWLYEQEKTFANALSLKAFEGQTLMPDVWAGPKQPTNGNEQPEEQKPLLQLIQESKTVKELEGWKLLINVEKDTVKKRELLIAYESNMAGLQNQPA